mmetsp:Transcript_25112/g.65823  ORF Transcript_25112/g.65823 Transcript_25112/m.65823 type:complete len:157 (-) Transcript_25112:175-645(-)
MLDYYTTQCAEAGSPWSDLHAHLAGMEYASLFSRPGKYQCQFIVGIEEERKFKVMRKLLGPSGANMRAIVDCTGAKLRLRGKGSRFLEGPEQVESSDPLMLCVSVTDRRKYDVAVSMAWTLMERVHGEYRGFCIRSGSRVPELHVQMHEGARPGSR